MIDKLAIIGVGLIGGSLARALKQAGHVRTVIGVGRSRESLQQAKDLGLIDIIAPSIAAGVEGADMVVVATPVGSATSVFQELAPALSDAAVVTDVGSVKGSVVAAATATFGARLPLFVPGHPIAGTEKSGAQAAQPDLFRGRRVILTPLSTTRPQAIERVRALWQAAGAEVLTMSATEHDDILGATSHLPHMLAYALVHMLAQADRGRALFDFAGGGLRDFSRIASSDPVMWRDICLANRPAIVQALGQYQGQLQALTAAIERGDAGALQELFARAKQTRDAAMNDKKGGG